MTIFNNRHMRSASITQPQIKAQILSTAEALFRTYGYGKTTVADIARECGMSPANVYRFFESKKSVNEAITEVILYDVEALAQAIAREQRGAADRLRKLIFEVHGFTCDRLIKDTQVHELCALAMEEQWGVIDAHIHRMRMVVRKIVEEGMASGEFAKADLDFTEACVNNAIIPFCHPTIVAQNFAKDGKRQAVSMAEFLVAALKAKLPE